MMTSYNNINGSTNTRACYTIETLGADPDREGNSIYKICTPATVELVYDDPENPDTPTGARLIGPAQTTLIACTAGGTTAILTPPECEKPLPDSPREGAGEMENY